MTRTEKEYEVGKKNGAQASDEILQSKDGNIHFLVQQNLIKAKKGTTSEFPLIQAYWIGWIEGFLNKTNQTKP